MLKINNNYRDHIMGLDIIIKHAPIHNLMHEVFFLPLMFNRYTQSRINDVHLFTSTKAQPRIVNQVPNHTYNKFIEYNLLANMENHVHYPQQCTDDLPNPNTELAVRQHQDQKTIFGETFESKTEVFRKLSVDNGFAGG